jgi:hypothetical protein
MIIGKRSRCFKNSRGAVKERESTRLWTSSGSREPVLLMIQTHITVCLELMWIVADLIMLDLATHELNFTIREEFRPLPKRCDICGYYGLLTLP